MATLLVAILGLFVGPLLVRVGQESRSLRAGADGLAMSLVLGTCVVWLLPHALEHAGLWALAGLVAGAALPIGLHRLGAGRGWEALGLGLLGIHVLLDGAALAMVHDGSSGMVAIAVAAHRIPVGTAVAYRSRSQLRAALALGSLGALTVLGYVLGISIPLLVPDTAHGAMEAAVVGVLLHIVVAHPPPTSTPVDVRAKGTSFTVASVGPLVLSAPVAAGAMSFVPTGHVHGPGCGHAHHDHGPDTNTPSQARASAIGVLLGIGALAAARVATPTHHDHDHIGEAGAALLTLSLTSAPALLAGFVFAGVVSAVIRPGHVQGGGRVGQAVRGVVFGLPLPICSCGVVPMYQSLIRRGVPLTAGLAFLVATPELGLDAILLSLPLLGLPLTLARVAAAVVVALTVALVVGSAATSTPVDVVEETSLQPLGLRLREGLRYGLVELVDHTLPWVLLGLGVAALAEPLIDHEALASVPAFLQVPLAAVIGIPLYVCASGATPLAAVAVHKGLSAGAALTFLLAGPASNVTTFGVLSQLHGRALAFRFGAVLTVMAILIGWGADLAGVTVPMAAHPGALDAHGHAWWNWVCLVGLVIVSLASLFRMGGRGVLDQILQPVHAH